MTRPAIQLRPATPTDLTAILTLERATENAPHWSPATYAAILETQNSRCLFVAEITAKPQAAIVGFAVGLIHPTEPIAELESVAVAASAQRNGIGRTLCTAVIDWSRERGATSITLEVRANSAAAMALYTKLGFVPEGRRPLYYRDPDDDALLFSLPL
jgi:[ribosomal protein S18]-alanine N-acetyltransferase